MLIWAVRLAVGLAVQGEQRGGMERSVVGVLKALCLPALQAAACAVHKAQAGPKISL